MSGAAHQVGVIGRVTREFVEASHDPERLFEIIARQLAESIGDSCAVFELDHTRTLLLKALYDRDPAIMLAAREVHSEPLTLDRHPIPRGVIDTGEPFMAELPPDAMRPPQTTPAYYAFGRHIGMHGVLIVPLRARGKVSGQLVLLRHRATLRPYDEEDRALAAMLADHAALALDNALAYARAAQAQRQQEEFFAGSPMAMYAFDVTSHRIVAANSAALRLYGYARDEMIGQPVQTLFAPDEPPLPAVLDEIGSAAVRRTARQRRRDGTLFEADATSHQATVAGRPARFEVVTEVTDITSAIRQRERAQSRFDGLAKSGLVGIFFTDSDGIIREANAALADLLGYREAELLGMHESELVSPVGRVQYSVLIAGLEERRTLAPRVLAYVRKDHRLAPVLNGAAQLDSEVIHFVLDLAGREWAATAVEHVREAQHAQERLQRANKELESFSYSVAHDLRAPLRAMSGFASLVAAAYGDKLDEQGKDWLAEIVANAGKLGDLIDGLLALSQLSRGELSITRVDLAAIARDVCLTLALETPARSVKLIITDPLIVDADARLARIVLENLIGNAWKFTRDTPSARIEVGGVERGDERVFFVSDNGTGFDMANAKMLFAPFQRFHNTFEFPGTGIGLATVQRVIHRHGGRIWAEAQPGAGATFSFTFAPGASAQEGAR